MFENHRPGRNATTNQENYVHDTAVRLRNILQFIYEVEGGLGKGDAVGVMTQRVTIDGMTEIIRVPVDRSTVNHWKAQAFNMMVELGENGRWSEAARMMFRYQKAATKRASEQGHILEEQNNHTCQAGWFDPSYQDFSGNTDFE